MQGLRVILALLQSKSPLGCQHLQLGRLWNQPKFKQQVRDIPLPKRLKAIFVSPSHIHPGNRLWFQSVFNKLLFLLELIKENQESFSLYGIPSSVLYQFESDFKDVHFHFITEDTNGREFWVETRITYLFYTFFELFCRVLQKGETVASSRTYTLILNDKGQQL